MNRMQQPYTVGIWTVKPGKETAFIDEWTTFARWTARNQPGAGMGYLLQDSLNPLQFISYGPWDDTAAIDAWRHRAEFRAFAERAKELCDEFQPRTLVQVSGTE